MMRVGLDLFAQAHDGMIDRSRRHVRVDVAPDFLQQFFAMDDTVAPFCEIPEQFELPMGQMHGQIAADRALRSEIDDQPPDRQTLERRVRTAEHCADSCEKLLQIERFGDVVVGAQPQPLQLVHLLATSRQDDDGHFARLTEHRAEVEAIDIGQRQIEHDEIGDRRAHVCDG